MRMGASRARRAGWPRHRCQLGLTLVELLVASSLTAAISLTLMIPKADSPEELAQGFKQLIRTDWNGVRTAIERIVDQRISASS